VKVRGGKVIEQYGTLVNPRRPIPDKVVKLTGITDDMAAEGEQEDVAMQKLLDFIGEDVLVGHNISFDYSFVKQWAVNRKIPLELYACDTLRIARAVLPGAQSKKLADLCAYFGISRENAHRALDDAVETQKVFECLTALTQDKPQLLEPRLMTYKAKRQTPATPHQKERLRELVEQYSILDPIYWETLTRSEASRLHDQIKAGKFSASQE
jgi:DNA polymerase-3 subunit alpha (Gram-positive type)